MSEFSNLSSLKMLRSVDLLSRLTILQLSHIAESLSEVSYSDGQIIVDRVNLLFKQYIFFRVNWLFKQCIFFLYHVLCNMGQLKSDTE